MAKSLTYEIIANELESYEKKVEAYTKLLSDDISKLQSKKSQTTLTKDEVDELINKVYHIMSEIEPDLSQKLLELWSVVN